MRCNAGYRLQFVGNTNSKTRSAAAKRPHLYSLTPNIYNLPPVFIVYYSLMKRILKKYEKYLSIRHYISVLRRQPAHMQHVYAIIFAGSITALIAGVILYTDYGFWREKYNRNEVLEVQEETDTTDPMVTVESPAKMIGGFFREASVKLKSIDVTVPDGLLEGKDNYTREEQVPLDSKTPRQ